MRHPLAQCVVAKVLVEAEEVLLGLQAAEQEQLEQVPEQQLGL